MIWYGGDALSGQPQSSAVICSTSLLIALKYIFQKCNPCTHRCEIVSMFRRPFSHIPDRQIYFRLIFSLWNSEKSRIFLYFPNKFILTQHKEDTKGTKYTYLRQEIQSPPSAAKSQDSNKPALPSNGKTT